MAVARSIEKVVHMAAEEGLSYGEWVAKHEPPPHNGYTLVGRDCGENEKEDRE